MGADPSNEPANRVIFHLDMDAFYASVEQRDNPAFRGKPVVVGGAPDKRGVVAAASYEARKFGVRSAMPSSTAARLCPNAIFVRPHMEAYKEESRQVMGIIQETGALIEQMSIDEAYLEVTSRFQSPGSTTDALLELALPLAREIKERIRRERGLTASIGVAANKFLAKLASDFKKPDGLTLILEREKVGLLRPLPVRAIHGVGAATEKVLKGAGINTVGDLQDYRGDLRPLVGSFTQQLRDFAFGIDRRPLEPGDEVKSISAEETFERDTLDRKQLRMVLWEQAREIAAKLERKGLAAHTVQVKIRYGDFKTLTRQIRIEDPLRDARNIYRLGCFLLARDQLVQRPVRLLGLGVSGLAEGEPRQLKFL